MELIIGCLFLLLTAAFLFYFCKNAEINININYPEIHYEETKDIYDEEGNSKIDDGEQITFDDILKEINDLMLDKEESDG